MCTLLLTFISVVLTLKCPSALVSWLMLQFPVTLPRLSAMGVASCVWWVVMLRLSILRVGWWGIVSVRST